jgi:hypothetical protein
MFFFFSGAADESASWLRLRHYDDISFGSDSRIINFNIYFPGKVPVVYNCAMVYTRFGPISQEVFGWFVDHPWQWP